MQTLGCCTTDISEEVKTDLIHCTKVHELPYTAECREKARRVLTRGALHLRMQESGVTSDTFSGPSGLAGVSEKQLQNYNKLSRVSSPFFPSLLCHSSGWVCWRTNIFSFFSLPLLVFGSLSLLFDLACFSFSLLFFFFLYCFFLFLFFFPFLGGRGEVKGGGEQADNSQRLEGW